MSGIIGSLGHKSGIVNVGSTTQWKDLTPYLVNSWASQGSASHPVRYRIWGDLVIMNGLIKDGNNPIFVQNAPVEMRPTKFVMAASARDGGYNAGSNSHQALYINPDGSFGHYDYKSSWNSMNIALVNHLGIP